MISIPRSAMALSEMYRHRVYSYVRDVDKWDSNGTANCACDLASENDKIRITLLESADNVGKDGTCLSPFARVLWLMIGSI
jgi:hypothetical protein